MGSVHEPEGEVTSPSVITPLRRCQLARSPTDCAQAGVSGKQVFAVLSASLMQSRSDPASELAEILRFVNKDNWGRATAEDDDLIYWDHLGSQLNDREARDGMYRMFTHYRLQTIVLTEKGEPLEDGTSHSVFERLETMAYLALSTFCQRIVNASDDVVRESVQLDKIMNLPNLLKSLRHDSKGSFTQIAGMLDSVIRKLTPVAHDAEGFRVFCVEASISWLPYPYIKDLVIHGGPFPRRQDLNQKRLIIGKVPKGRKIVVSHGWDSSFHISPGGDKMRLICNELERIGATGNDDAVFVDYCGLSQGAPAKMPEEYFQRTGICPEEFKKGERTHLDWRQFTYSLWEVSLAACAGAFVAPSESWCGSLVSQMSRMYAYKEVEVIVLPQRADPDNWGENGKALFQDGDKIELQGTSVKVLTGAMRGEEYDNCSTNGEGQVITLKNLVGRKLVEAIEAADGDAKCSFSNVCRWGRVNPDPYQCRGWVRPVPMPWYTPDQLVI